MSLNPEKLKRRRKKRAKQATGRQNPRPRSTNMSSRELKRLLGPLEEAAEERDELKERYKECVAEANSAAMKASKAGVPLKLIVEAGKFTRQYFYQIEKAFENNQHKDDPAPKRKRTNGTKRKTSKKKTSPFA